MDAQATLGMIGAVFGPWVWGVARDHTGAFHLGFIGLAVVSTLGATLLLTGARRRAPAQADSVAGGPGPSRETESRLRPGPARGVPRPRTWLSPQAALGQPGARSPSPCRRP